MNTSKKVLTELSLTGQPLVFLGVSGFAAYISANIKPIVHVPDVPVNCYETEGSGRKRLRLLGPTSGD